MAGLKNNSGNERDVRAQKKMPGRLEDPNERRGTEWAPPEGDPAKEQPNRPDPARREPDPDPEKKVSRVDHNIERD